ncbi:MAG: hypothetical protein JNM19_13815, partial [Chitinophagaceae bacterium]|nr:hypothetical protein [Chitinophagaceae bacterium]
MRNKHLYITMGFALFMLSTVATAQKPNPASSAEIKLPAENDNWHIDGNMRILDRTGRPSAIYQVAF